MTIVVLVKPDFSTTEELYVENVTTNVPLAQEPLTIVLLVKTLTTELTTLIVTVYLDISMMGMKLVKIVLKDVPPV